MNYAVLSINHIIADAFHDLKYPNTRKKQALFLTYLFSLLPLQAQDPVDAPGFV